MAQWDTGRKIKVGVVGVGRGQSFMGSAAEVAGMELVAICDTWEERLNEVCTRHHVAGYTDYDKFLEHDMDAVVLANYFHQHAPFALKAMDAGKHVMSETASNATMAEGVALCRKVEQTGLIYMLAENYPYSVANQELRRLYQADEVGAVRYAEGEYNHAGEENWRLSISPGLNHWRNWCPSTYYCTHALGPLMYITDTMPVSVNALSIIEDALQAPNTVKVSDIGSVILARMDNGAVFRIWGLMMSSIHRVRYEVHGERGMISTCEPNHWSTVRIHHEDWLRGPGQLREKSYAPDWPEYAELANRAGHGGGDFWTNFHFANAIRTGEQPYLNVYRGVAMSSVGIIGWKSALEEGAPIAMPDFTNEAARAAYENDHWSPWPEDAGPGQPPASMRGNITPSVDAIAHARSEWQKIGYNEEATHA